MKGIFLIFVCALVLCSCNQGKKPVSIVGTVDTLGIASDTTVQKAIESSYEYAQTLNVSEKLVYDIRAYGGPASKGMYAIIRRGANNKPDTIVKAERNGIIANAFLADMDNDKQPEVYIAMQTATTNRYGSVSGWKVDAAGKAIPMTFTNMFAKTAPFYYKGSDTIYAGEMIPGKKAIVMDFPAYRKQDSLCCPRAGRVQVFYLVYKNDIYSNGIHMEDSTQKILGFEPPKTIKH